MPYRRLASFLLPIVISFVTGSCSDHSVAPKRPVPASLEIVAGNQQTAVVGKELPDPLIVRVLDANQAPINGQIVNFRVVAGNGTVFAGAATTNSDGIAQERWKLGTVANDTQRVEARAVNSTSGAPEVFGVFTAVGHADVAAQLTALAGANQIGKVGAALHDSLVARVTDQYGNPVPQIAVAWSLPNDAGTLTQSTTSTSDSGLASTKWTTGTKTGHYNATATVGQLTPATFPVTIAAADPTALHIVAGDGASAVVNNSVTLAVQVLDVYGNPVAGAPVDFEVVSGTGVLSPSGNATATDDGIASTSLTLGTTAGDNTVRASVTGLSSVTLHVTASPGPPTAINKFRGDGQTAPPGTNVAIDPTARVVDAFGNPCPGVTVAFAIAGGGGTIGATTAVTNDSGLAFPGHWTLGPAKGLNTLVATLGGLSATFTATAGSLSPDIQVSVFQPVPDEIVGDQATVRVRVTSRFSVASVTAVSGANQAALSAGGSSVWLGLLSLQNLPRDTVQMIVTASDINGASTDAIVRVIHDRKPTISIAVPIDNSVARPSIDIDAECSDDDPAGCTQFTVDVEGSQLLSGTGHVTGTVSLAAWNGKSVSLNFTAVDSRGQVTSSQRVLLVEGSTHITELASATGSARDYSGGRLLYLDNQTTPQTLAIHSSAGDQVIPVDAKVPQSVPLFLSPSGAIFPAVPSGTAWPNLYDWRNGALNTSAGLNASSSLDVNGDFAIYVLGTGSATTVLHRRDFTTGNDIVIASDVGNTENSVAPNGDVAYWRYDYDVYWYHGGVVTRLTADDDNVFWNTYPVTDGTSVVFSRSGPTTRGPYSIMRGDGASLVQLATVTEQPYPGRDYTANNGWIAFLKVDAGGTLQVWTRAPDGTLRQVSQFGVPSRIDALADDGSVVFTSGTTRYYAGPTGGITPVGSSLGIVIWRDHSFVLLIGRSAFQISP